MKGPGSARRFKEESSLASPSFGGSSMSKFFINRPIVAMVIAIIMVIVGVVRSSACRSRSIPILFAGNRD